jgi:hypothetical protein
MTRPSATKETRMKLETIVLGQEGAVPFADIAAPAQSSRVWTD